MKFRNSKNFQNQLTGMRGYERRVCHILLQHLLLGHRTISNKFLKAKDIFTIHIHFFFPLSIQHQNVNHQYLLWLYQIPDGVPTNQKVCTGFHFLCKGCWLNTWDNQILVFQMICRQEC